MDMPHRRLGRPGLKVSALSTVITGASRVEQVQENMAAVDVLGVLEKEAGAVERLDRAFGPIAR